MAGKGGGAWKVAYADFVTAMMAFFLVMWLISQDQKVKESIAHYFQGPVGINLLGDTSRSKQAGGMFYSEVMGPVPGQTMRTAGRSIGTSPEPPAEDSVSLAVAEWMFEDQPTSQRWNKAAREQLEQAKNDPRVQRGSAQLEAVAKTALAKRMRTEMMSEASGLVKGVYQDVLVTALSQADWIAIAEEVMMHCRKPDEK
jgi:chemotaxis protein MotB